MIRVCYWIQGISKHRPGGPWWHKDFETEPEADNFIKFFRPVCREIRKTSVESDFHESMDIAPPEEVEKVWPPEGIIPIPPDAGWGWLTKLGRR